MLLMGVYSVSHFVHIGVPIVDGGDATERAGHMVEQFLRNVDRRSKSCKVRAEGAA